MLRQEGLLWETMVWLDLEEQHERALLSYKMSLGVAPSEPKAPAREDKASPYPVRIRKSPQRYQSQEVEKQEKSQRRSEDQTNRPKAMELDVEQEESHDWKEGECLGQAKNPGPPYYFYTPPWIHAPGLRPNFAQAQAGWCGTRAVLQVPAGEYAKGICPGPKPSSAGVGPVPHRNTGCNEQSVNMKIDHKSRAETVQHTHTHTTHKNRKMCWHGLHCWGKGWQCPFQHPEWTLIHEGVRNAGSGQGGQPTQNAWGGKGKQGTAHQQVSSGKGSGWDGGWERGKGSPPENSNSMGPRLRSPAGAGPQVGRPQQLFESHLPHALGRGMPPPPAQMARGAFASMSLASSQTGKMGGGRWNGLPQSSNAFWPLKSNYAQKGVGKLGADQEGQPTRSAWGGRGRQQLSLGKGGWDRGWGWGKGLPPESANGMGTCPRSPAGAGPQVGRPQRPFEPHPPHALGKGMPPLPA